MKNFVGNILRSTHYLEFPLFETMQTRLLFQNYSFFSHSAKSLNFTMKVILEATPYLVNLYASCAHVSTKQHMHVISYKLWKSCLGNKLQYIWTAHQDQPHHALLHEPFRHRYQEIVGRFLFQEIQGKY